MKTPRQELEKDIHDAVIKFQKKTGMIVHLIEVPMYDISREVNTNIYETKIITQPSRNWRLSWKIG